MSNLNDFMTGVDRLASFGWIKPGLKASLDESLARLAPSDFDAASIVWIQESVAHPNSLQPVLCAITTINARAAQQA